MYVSNSNALEIPFAFKTYMAQAEEKALVDSGATENFIDYKTVARLRLGSNKLERPRPVHNVDGTPNKSGGITNSVTLYVKFGDKEQRVEFFVTNLGKDRMILGHPWLHKFNPVINWKQGTINGKLEIATTAAKRLIGQQHILMARRLISEPRNDRRPQITNMAELETHTHSIIENQRIRTSELGERIRKTSIAQQMAEKAYDKDKVNTEQTIPPEYQRHEKVFSEQEATRFPPPRPWDHRIKLTSDAPATINGKIYPLPAKITQELDAWIDKMLERGFISLSDSNYGSPTFGVAKKDGTQRIVQDFRELNKYTVKDVTPLPDIRQAIEGLGDKVLFSKFDVREGYNNIQIVPEDRWKTAFKTHRGLFEFNVMPFGLCNAPGTFSRGLGNDVQAMYKEFPLNRFKHYMDDCIIGTAQGELPLHRKMTHRLLDIFEEHSYFLKPSKCEFEQESTTFLGVQLGNGEVAMDPAKIAGVRDWPETLNSVKDVRSVLGVLGFQRPFIRNFAHIAKPLTDLLKKDTPFDWSEKCRQALRTLKNIVTSEPILIPPDPTRQFILEVDASQYATGGILYQADKTLKDKRGNPILRPCGYCAKTFSATEQNYPIYDREYLAIMRGLEHWDYLLRGPKDKDNVTIVITDHANLQYYRHPHKIGPRIAGYIGKREEYPIRLMYKPGKTNRADALSRRPDFAPDPHNDEPVIALPADLFVAPNAPILDLEVLSRSVQKPTIHCRTIDLSMDPLEELVLTAQTNSTTTLNQWQKAHGIEARPGGLWWKNKALVVVGNDDLKRGVLRRFHDHIAAGHPGITKTLINIGQHYWWPGMKDFITQYIKGCATCQMTKINTHPSKPALFPIATDPKALPFQVIALDFVTDLPVSQGFDSILTVTDHDCSKASIFIPCNKTITAEGTAELYARHIVPHYGLPTRIISGHRTRFRHRPPHIARI